MADAEAFRIEAGMHVLDRDGEPVGRLESILTERESGRSRFLTVERRLLPVEAVLGVEGDRVRLGVARSELAEFPERGPDEPPDPEALLRAYRALGIDGPLVE